MSDSERFSNIQFVPFATIQHYFNISLKIFFIYLQPIL